MGKIKKFENWPERLEQYLSSCSQKDFKWGRFDCALFATDAIQAMTGQDLAHRFRRRYRSAYGAKRLTRKYGSLLQLADAIAKQWNLSKQEASWAQRGDVVAIDTQSGEALGICLGASSAFPNEVGLSLKPTGECRCSWRV